MYCCRGNRMNETEKCLASSVVQKCLLSNSAKQVWCLLISSQILTLSLSDIWARLANDERKEAICLTVSLTVIFSFSCFRQLFQLFQAVISGRIISNFVLKMQGFGKLWKKKFRFPCTYLRPSERNSQLILISSLLLNTQPCSIISGFVSLFVLVLCGYFGLHREDFVVLELLK